jgi:hypothetical protein
VDWHWWTRGSYHAENGPTASPVACRLEPA